MVTINLNQGGHSWKKQNLVTQFKGKRSYDILKCEKCGIVGKTNSLSTIALKGSYSEEKILNCDGKSQMPTKIRITICYASGPQFTNLIPKSEHDVVAPPAGYKNDQTGVWVQGVGEPVKVLREEYEII